jgi:hypothetical protein
MIYHLAIHRPKSGKESFLIDSMHRFGDSIRNAPGLREVHTLQDKRSGTLIGLAVWESTDYLIAARPLMVEAVKDDPFHEWEDNEPEVFLLEEV